MRIHLSKYDVLTLRKQVAESEELGDDGEFFAEEALGCFRDEEIDALEEAWDGSAEDFFMEVFGTWLGAEPEAVVETLTTMLADLDIELTHDEPDEEDEEEFEVGESWSDDDEDEEELEEEPY